MKEQWEELLAATRAQLIVRAAVVVATVVFALALALAGGVTWDPWLMVVAPLLGLLAAAHPHSGLPTLLVVYLVGLWALTVTEPWTPWSLLGAACLLVVHAASALAAGVPVAARLPASLARRYAPRLAVVLAATALVWGAVGIVRGGQLAGGTAGMLIGLLVLAVAAGGHYRWMARWSRDR
ncbi:hypothetical protein [Georgenia alba]|uniref:Uncharacterized protein n=1 Tax=Georgenia alba TaxID=2233858 RepID=A0ABW2Q2E7_9MICO